MIGEILGAIRIEAILGGALAGLAYGLSGYFKAVNADLKGDYSNLDWTKLGITVLAAGVCGGIAGARGLGISVVESSSLGAMVAIVADKVVKGISAWWNNRKKKK